MDRKNATILFLFRFVTDYGKENLPMKTVTWKMNNEDSQQETVAYVPMLKRRNLKRWIVRIRLFIFYQICDWLG